MLQYFILSQLNVPNIKLIFVGQNNCNKSGSEEFLKPFC